MTKSIYETKAAQSLSAWIVMRGKKQVGRILAHYGSSRVTVEVHDYTGTNRDVQRSSASGYGYDKLTSALQGMTLNGVEFTDHCGDQIKKTSRNTIKGNVFQGGDHVAEVKLFPREYKPRKGYRLANWQSGTHRIRRANDDGSFSHWENKTCDNAIEGYANCFRTSGVDILRELGYTVIQAI